MFPNLKTSNSILIVTLAFVSLYFLKKCESSRIYFSSCGSGGFSCVLTTGKYKITYQCPNNENDPLLHLWQFRAPASTESLTIKNCTNLKLSLQCSGENKPINYLTIANVTNLVFVKSMFSHLPERVVLENIENLEHIPEDTFTQIKKKMPMSGCINPARDFQNLHFHNVNIGTIAPKAFNDLKNFGNFTWSYVNVKRLQHLAVEVELSQASNFSISKSILEVCEHLAFKICGTRVLFVENKFLELYPGAINGTMGQFMFSINSVTNLQPYGIAILSEAVHISDNRFDYVRTGAFEKISPGLLQNSQRNFGKLKFVYEFSHNSVNFMDAGSLNPDMQAYDNVATELRFHHNGFFCSCENVGWMFSEIGYGYSTALMQEFYETVTAENYKNFCSHTSCGLPLNSVSRLIVGGKCLQNKTAENVCKSKEENESNIQVASQNFSSRLLTSSSSNYFVNRILFIRSVLIKLVLFFLIY